MDALALAPVARRLCLIANPNSGRNSRDRTALDAALGILGPGAELRPAAPGSDIAALVAQACTDGAEIVVAAGGDGTATAVASAMLGRPQAMAVLPLGTFNYFARGLGYEDAPELAARQIIRGRPHPIRVGIVNGQVFLNNASLGIYPAVLRAREGIYARWGRRRLAAHWSLVRTFLQFRKPMKVTLALGGTRTTRRTALVFVARSAFQLEKFRLEGAGAISDDGFAVLVARAETRRALWRMAFRLALGAAEAGRDYDWFGASDLTIELHRRRRTLLAFDGEKRREPSPIRFTMSDERLNVMLPPHRAGTGQDGAG